MTKIVLEGMHFYAYHGYYEEERLIGNHFVVDVEVQARANRGAMTDDLTGTVNYETIYTICRIEMRKPSQLIEHVAQRIAGKIQHQFSFLQSIRVRISKQQPPLGGPVRRAYVEVQHGS